MEVSGVVNNITQEESDIKLLQLLMWVGQFGFSVVFPTLAFLTLAVWLRQRYGLGSWVLAVLGILGLLTSFSTAKSCLRSMQKAAEEAGSKKTPPTSFNDHS